MVHSPGGETCGGLRATGAEKNGYVINNYYIEGKAAPVLEALLKQIAEDTAGSLPLYAVALLDDADVFERQAFVVEKKWTRYVRMRKG